MKTSRGAPNDLVLSFTHLRLLIGVIAMTMPVAVFLGHAVFGAHSGTPRYLDSVSQSYYREVGALFVGFLCAIGVFLICYRGFERGDAWACRIAGISAILVSQVPCGPGCRAPLPANEALWGWSDTYALGDPHLAFAAIMFIALGYLCLFQFTKSSAPPHALRAPKRRRNLIYRICGWIIFGTLAADVVVRLLHLAWPTTTIVEFVMIEAFGISWLVKSETWIPRSLAG